MQRMIEHALQKTDSALRCPEESLVRFYEAVSYSKKTQLFIEETMQEEDFLFFFRDIWVALYEEMSYHIQEIEQPYHRLLAKVLDTNAYVMCRRMTVKESLPALVGAYHITEYCYPLVHDDYLETSTVEEQVERAYEMMRMVIQGVDELVDFNIGMYEFREQIVIAELIADTQEAKEIAKYSRIFQQIIDEVGAMATDTYTTEFELMQHRFFIEGSPETVTEYLKKKKAAETMLQSHYRNNVIYVPFQNAQQGDGPYIICLEQTARTKRFDIQTKALVLLISRLAKQYGRDLCIIPYANDVKGHYYFEKGNIPVDELSQFVRHYEDGEANILPALSFALTILRQNDEQQRSDIIFITEGGMIREQRLLDSTYKQAVESFLTMRNVDVSALVLNERLFDEQQYWFINDVYFAEELFE
ncbi:VWA domain-containing protein [Caryophanon tenue]|nr:VWA domain-containing protein [Caryophanon tenue]